MRKKLIILIFIVICLLSSVFTYYTLTKNINLKYNENEILSIQIYTYIEKDEKFVLKTELQKDEYKNFLDILNKINYKRYTYTYDILLTNYIVIIFKDNKKVEISSHYVKSYDENDKEVHYKKIKCNLSDFNNLVMNF